MGGHGGATGVLGVNYWGWTEFTSESKLALSFGSLRHAPLSLLRSIPVGSGDGRAGCKVY